MCMGWGEMRNGGEQDHFEFQKNNPDFGLELQPKVQYTRCSVGGQEQYLPFYYYIRNLSFTNI